MSPLGQVQNVSDNSVAAQSGRDTNITIQGVSVSEVKLLVDAFVQSHLPALRAAARDAAEQNAQRFLQCFVSELSKSQTASAQEFTKPDAQNSFNDAVRGCALKGDDADIDLVAQMLVERLSSTDKPVLKLVSEAAIRALPVITREHIALLTLLHFGRYVKLNSVTTVAQLNAFFAHVLPLVRPAFSVSDASKRYLESVGVLSVNEVADANILPGNMRQHYPFLPAADDDLRKAGGEAILEFLDAHAKMRAQVLFPTSVGQLIAVKNLARVLPVDAAVWIN